MVLMKAADDRLSKGIGTGEFMCVYWPSRGQEAIAAAMGCRCDRTTSCDDLSRAARSDRQGVPLEEIYGEMMGRTVGASRGKGGTCTSPTPARASCFPPGSSGPDRRWRWTGDGGKAQRAGSRHGREFRRRRHQHRLLSRGGQHAALWDLPLVLLCQNNLYAEMTPTSDTMKLEHVAERAAGYGMPGVLVDGNDPLAVKSALDEALQRARTGGGPTFLECVTFRFRGHYFGDRMPYIPRRSWRRRWRPTRCPSSATTSSRRAPAHPTSSTASTTSAGDGGDCVGRRYERGFHSIDELDRDVYATRSSSRCEAQERPQERMEEIEMTMREALNLALDEALAADDRVFLLVRTSPIRARPDRRRVLSTKYGTTGCWTPDSEAAIVGAAIGAAIDGMLPVAEIMIMDFIGIAADQLINNAAKLRFMTAGRTTARSPSAPRFTRDWPPAPPTPRASRRGSCISPG